jgi:type III restriction enzyme
MNSFEVPEPILNAPFAEPAFHWYIREGEEAQKRPGRRPSIVYPPRDERRDRHVQWSLTDGTLRPSTEYAPGYEMVLVILLRERVAAWRKEGYPNVSRTTLQLLQWWRREGRQRPLFFAQIEAAETVIFLTEARPDFLQGITVPRDEPSDERKAEGFSGFLRYACKMATGSGKTTVMGMLAAWSILNKAHNRGDARFSDVVLVVCPNVTIRSRLRELDPEYGEGSIYRTRDLVPPALMKDLTQGKVLVMNWHGFEPQAPAAGGERSRVLKAGREERTVETIQIGNKTTTARGSRYLTQEAYEQQVASGMLKVIEEERDKEGALKKVRVESVRYVESDTALITRILGRDIGGKKNILVMNDEAHHAYRIKREEPDENEAEIHGEEDEAEEFFQEATVWIDGLDRIQKNRGINFCVDLSATPYFLGRVGQETNRPFPWVVSDFGLIDAIESGLTKIPQLAVRDTTGAGIVGGNDQTPSYFNIWRWILETKLTPAERGAKRASPKPEAILKYANTPIAMLGGLWEQELADWKRAGHERPPVFIIVCKTTPLARMMYEWLAEGKPPTGLPPSKLEGFRNTQDRMNTIRVDSKVVHESDTGEAKSDGVRWMRFTLDTVGKTDWPTDRQGRPQYPDGFEELAAKLERPLSPPGRDVRCIVSVAMLTEGWDCNTVTHIIGLRPFMSQLLCEQVVGRGLRRRSYEVDDSGKFTEEVAKVFGVPFEVIPFKANTDGPPVEPPKRRHVHALPSRGQYEMHFPRVEGYTQALRNRIFVDWQTVAPVVIDPMQIPPEVEMKASLPNNQGRASLTGPGKLENVTLNPYRSGRRLQESIFDMATALTRDYANQPTCAVPAHALFPQILGVVDRYIREKVKPVAPAERQDAFLSPYYGWMIERLVTVIRSDTGAGETAEIPRYEANRPAGSTADVDFWTSKDVREVVHCHLNYAVADTQRWEQSATYYIDRHRLTEAFVKNAGLYFTIPYLHNGQMHDYLPDFIIRLKTEPVLHLILETKGHDPLEEVKAAAAHRWVNAVNAEGSYGRWRYEIVHRVGDIDGVLNGIG